MRVTVFMTPRLPALPAGVRELLSRYRALSPKIEVEYLDPSATRPAPRRSSRSSASAQNTVVFRSGDRKKYVEEDKLADFDFAGMQMGGGAPTIKAFKGEEAFTSAILAVTEERQPTGLLLHGARRGLARFGRARPGLLPTPSSSSSATT